jgi:Ca-activated chloride channel homolog
VPAEIDFDTLSVAQPLYLWLLVGPAILLVMGAWRFRRHRVDRRRLTRERLVPSSERHAMVGDLGFWLFLVLAAALCILALARPQATIAVVRRAGIDFVILQDGSASMYARDVVPDRWQRSVQFIRAFAEGLSWKGERVALALFAHRASPQIRLTRDPNALFFFLDNLGTRSPFRLEDAPTWDTNIEEALYWGLNLVEKDEEIFGKTSNVKAFIVVSDGQAWSGEVATALVEVRRRHAVVYVVGVGTTAGAVIPAQISGTENLAPPTHAVLDRGSLREIAHAGGGDYFELGRQPDRQLVSNIVTSAGRRSSVVREEERHTDLHWQCLFAASVVLCLGTLLLRDRAELWLHAAGAATGLLALVNALR